ncbi:hypothetical protein BaRGS_00035152 [Batillaria attramentaria]|uniref:Uncharacterized protein n=1 Tax=Batillaria attramentaria TaxID=370345 RepID=A0ABD0JFL0_9CAEN
MLGLAVLAVVFTASLADDSYVIVAPTKLRAGMHFSISVNILNATGDVTLTASVMRTDDRSTVASSTATLTMGDPKTVDIQIPADLTYGRYELHVAGAGGLTFTNHTSVKFSNRSLSVFLQTDKAIYVPGQKVNFRALAVYPDLQVYTGPMNVTIRDPNNNMIKQWLGVTGEEGVFTKFLNLSSRPVEGDWKIKAVAGNSVGEKTFTVEEYVPPKFEVKVIPPSYVLESDTTIPVTVTAKYTYGKPVTGPVTVEAKMPDYSYTGHVSHKAQLNNQGRAQLTFPMTEFRSLYGALAPHAITFTANVTESLTGITLIGSGTVKVYTEPVKVEFLPSNPKNFKPGLDYIGYVKISQPDGLPVPTSADENVTVHTTVQSSAVTCDLQYTFINIDLDPMSIPLPIDGLVTVHQLGIPSNTTSMTMFVSGDFSTLTV